jgi:hypothetical protein
MSVMAANRTRGQVQKRPGLWKIMPEQVPGAKDAIVVPKLDLLGRGLSHFAQDPCGRADGTQRAAASHARTWMQKDRRIVQKQEPRAYRLSAACTGWRQPL